MKNTQKQRCEELKRKKDNAEGTGNIAQWSGTKPNWF
jgi:hypothetical protein